MVAGCIDPSGERTRRDFEETGRADLGEVRVRIDQGVVIPSGENAPALQVRFRANAPEISVTLTSEASEARSVAIELENIAQDCEVSGVVDVRRWAKGLGFTVLLPAGAEVTVPVTRAALRVAATFHFAWVGDVQSGFEKFGRLREVVNADEGLEFVIFAGDVTQNGSDDEVAEFVAAADALKRPWYSVIGNHEMSFSSGGEGYQQRVGRLNTAFDYRGARFVLVDSASATLADRVWDFLDEHLAGSYPPLRLMAMHVPPLDPQGLRDAGFTSRDEGARVLARLVDGGVDLLLAGHLHTLRFSGNAGIQEVVSGNGGVATGDRFDGVGMHYLDVAARPDLERFDVQVVRVE